MKTYSMPDLPPWRMTLAEAASYAKESRQTLWRRHRDGDLRTTKHGRTIYVSRDALLEYLGVEVLTDESPANHDGTLASVISIEEVIPNAS